MTSRASKDLVAAMRREPLPRSVNATGTTRVSPKTTPSPDRANVARSGELRIEDEALPWGSVELVIGEPSLDDMRLEWIRERDEKRKRAEAAERRRRREADESERDRAPSLLDLARRNG